MVVPAKKHS